MRVASLPSLPHLSQQVTTDPAIHPWLAPVGLTVVLLSFLLIHEGPQFPGWQAIFPVAGTIALLYPVAASSSFVERWLSAPPLVRIGRMSYSLYLWHWPIFSLVDYRLYLAPEPVRLALKISLSFLAAYLSFRFIENPSRSFLNQRKARPLAFFSLTVVLAICISLGIWIRQANYINATFDDVAKGGLVFPGKPGASSVMLMGDSNGSMYGKVMKEICADLGYKLTVISVAAGDALPNSEGKSNRLWLDSLEAVRKERPGFLIFACNWESKLAKHPERLRQALEELAPLVGKVLVLNQPPTLPKNATREALRSGVRPPFREDAGLSQRRHRINRFLWEQKSAKTEVVDVASRFEQPNRETLFLDDHGHQLYHDAAHLSGHGADRIKSLLSACLK